MGLMGEIYAKATRTLIYINPMVQRLSKLEAAVLAASFWLSNKLKLMRGQSIAPHGLFVKARPGTIRELSNMLSSEKGEESGRWESRV
jgi:hypothetical protein